MLNNFKYIYWIWDLISKEDGQIMTEQYLDKDKLRKRRCLFQRYPRSKQLMEIQAMGTQHEKL